MAAKEERRQKRQRKPRGFKPKTGRGVRETRHDLKLRRGINFDKHPADMPILAG